MASAAATSAFTFHLERVRDHRDCPNLLRPGRSALARASVLPCDAGLRWNDARLAIDWPLAEPTLSEKDAHAPFLDQVAPGRLPVYEAAAVVAPGLPA